MRDWTDAACVDLSKPWFSEEAGWPDEVPKAIEMPLMTLGEMLHESARRNPDNRAIWFLDTFISYRQLDDMVDRMATGLHGIGLRKGDVVALLLPNSTQYVVSYFACARLGCIVTGVNPTHKPAEVLHQLCLTGAGTLIVLDNLYDPLVAPIIAKTGIERVIHTNIADLTDLSPFKRFFGKLLGKIPTGRVPSSSHSFVRLLRSLPTPPDVALDVHDPAVYMMTGGTTGVPKAAVMSHFNCVGNAWQCRKWLYKFDSLSVDIGVLPLFHAFAMTTIMNTSLITGAWMMLFPRPPKTDELIARIEALGPEGRTMYPGAEILFKRLAEMPGIEKSKIAKKFSLCVSGAGPLHRPIQEAFEARTGARLVEGYGLTEAGPVVSAGPFWGRRKIGTIGLPLPGTDWKIMDAEAFGQEKEPCPEGQAPDLARHIGELVVSGPQVMIGYLNDPDETANHIRQYQGKDWLLTGDIGYMDLQGRVVLMDRKKELIKVEGHSVFPKEVEELVGAHPAVLDAVVAGIPDRETGERVKTWLVLRPEYKGKITNVELIAWWRNNMAYYKVPFYVDFIDELPKNLIGKVQRRQLQENDPIYRAYHS